jgi:choline dehydrogenase
LTAGPLDHDGFTCRTCVLRPESRGRVGLRSADPLAPVRIEANYLAAENDVATLRRAVAMVREIMAQKAFDPFRGPELQPGPERQSDADLDAWIHAVAETIYHPVGTCRMGRDEMAVVDDSLRVHGVQGLRVVDASVMPTLTGGNTSAPTIMIAEKAVDMIRGLAALAPDGDARHPVA